MILEKKDTRNFKDFTSDSFITINQLLKLLEKSNKFKSDLLNVFDIQEDGDTVEVIKIGNAKYLLDSLLHIEKQVEKIDITTKIKDIHLNKMLEEEKALFEVFGVTNNFILKQNKSDLLVAETRYSAKSDLLDYFNFSKFANYCRDKEYADLIDSVKDYLKQKNFDNKEEKNLRLIYKNDEKKFYLRGITSSDGYQDFGINFSVFVALMTLGNYVKDTNNEIYINSYTVDESDLYVSFSLKKENEINKDLSITFSLLLENDEIKRSAVSFNGFFKLKYEDRNKASEIYLKPKGVIKENTNYPVELLTYQHRGSVENVFKRINDLPDLINYFIKQISKDAQKISNISHPDDVREFLLQNVKNARKPEFQAYKAEIKNKLMSMNVDNTFKLFELLREVEELFEHEDIISRDFWREKLYEALIDRK